MAKKYLDETGLAYFWSKIKSYIDASSGGSSLLDRTYPIGSIYISATTNDPATLFGGTWEQIEGKFLLSSSTTYTIGSTGGEASHTLTAAETGVHQHTHSFTQPTISSHNHKITDDTYVVTTSATTGITRAGVTTGSTTNFLRSTGGGLNRGGNYTDYAQPTASGGAVGNTTAASATSAHNNMPPYLVVHMWRRIA